MWLERGASPTPTVKTILNRAGVLEKWIAKKAK
jgi:ribosomal protein S16